jgi:hypothetical protein
MELTSDNIGDYAETFVRQMKQKGVLLDYSEESLAFLEELTAQSDTELRLASLPEAHRNLLVFYHGCYLGEVMARNLGGVWRFDAANWADSSLVFAYGSGGIQVFPFLKFWQRITETPQDHNLVTYYQGLKAKLAE